MTKADRIHSTPPETIPCPVLPIAERVGQLRKVLDVAEGEISGQIVELTFALETLASFEQARSLGGAMFQAALAIDTARTMAEKINSPYPALLCQVERLLESAITVLRSSMEPEEYAAVQRAVDAHSSIERPMHHPLGWLEEIPALAARGREVTSFRRARPVNELTPQHVLVDLLGGADFDHEILDPEAAAKIILDRLRDAGFLIVDASGRAQP